MQLTLAAEDVAGTLAADEAAATVAAEDAAGTLAADDAGPDETVAPDELAVTTGPSFPGVVFCWLATIAAAAPPRITTSPSPR